MNKIDWIDLIDEPRKSWLHETKTYKSYGLGEVFETTICNWDTVKPEIELLMQVIRDLQAASRARLLEKMERRPEWYLY